MGLITLLKSALLLLILAQTSPNLPQSFRDQAISVAQEAIKEATIATPVPVIQPKIEPVVLATSTPTHVSYAVLYNDILILHTDFPVDVYGVSINKFNGFGTSTIKVIPDMTNGLAENHNDSYIYRIPFSVKLEDLLKNEGGNLVFNLNLEPITGSPISSKDFVFGTTTFDIKNVRNSVSLTF